MYTIRGGTALLRPSIWMICLICC